MSKLSPAVLDVLTERERQINSEGWSPEHDDIHDKGQLAKAAAAYAQSSVLSDAFRGKYGTLGIPLYWPFESSWYRPTTARRDLVKAGALILAEIERLDRAAERGKSND